MKRFLFLDDCNMFEANNPLAYLVEVPDETDSKLLYTYEKSQIGVPCVGGDWRKIMQDGNIKYTLISEGRKSNYSKRDYDELYKLISGNY